MRAKTAIITKSEMYQQDKSYSLNRQFDKNSEKTDSYKNSFETKWNKTTNQNGLWSIFSV